MKVYISKNMEEELMNLIQNFPKAIRVEHLLRDLPGSWHLKAISEILIDYERKIRQKLTEIKLQTFLEKAKYLKVCSCSLLRSS
jgi:hypothetical protein